MVQGRGNDPKTKEYGQEQHTKSKINIKNRNDTVISDLRLLQKVLVIVQ